MGLVELSNCVAANMFYTFLVYTPVSRVDGFVWGMIVDRSRTVPLLTHAWSLHLYPAACKTNVVGDWRKAGALKLPKP